MEKKFKEATGMDFNEYYKRIKDKLYSYLIGKNFKNIDVDDVISETFLRLLTKIDKYDSSKASLSTYLYKIALNVSLERYNNNCKLPIFTVEDYFDCNIFDIEVVDYDDDIDYMYNKVKDYVYSNCDLSVILWFERVKIKEISEITNLNTNTIKSRIRKFKREINKDFNKENEFYTQYIKNINK